MTNPSEIPNDDTLWDASDVARYLKVSRSWVYHRAEAGELPHQRVGGLLRFEPEVIKKFVSDGQADIVRPRRLPRAPRALRKGA